MPYDPNFPPDHQPLNGAPFRDQFNALKALVDAQSAQLAAWQAQFTLLVPVVTRSAGGVWTMTYNGPTLDYWQVWVRYEGSEAWSESGELPPSAFPAVDADLVPDGTPWWQIKFCGENGDWKPNTPFSNIISFGPVP
jgi:hypothetical protein